MFPKAATMRAGSPSVCSPLSLCLLERFHHQQNISQPLTASHSTANPPPLFFPNSRCRQQCVQPRARFRCPGYGATDAHPPAAMDSPASPRSLHRSQQRGGDGCTQALALICVVLTLCVFLMHKTRASIHTHTHTNMHTHAYTPNARVLGLSTACTIHAVVCRRLWQSWRMPRRSSLQLMQSAHHKTSSSALWRVQRACLTSSASLRRRNRCETTAS